jgi:hypothetical protein
LTIGLPPAIESSINNLPNFNSDEWHQMFRNSTFLYPFNTEEIPLSDQPAPLLQSQDGRTFEALNDQ